MVAVEEVQLTDSADSRSMQREVSLLSRREQPKEREREREREREASDRREMTDYRWFFGDISSHEAVERLGEAEPGTFLFRFSTSQPGYCYST